MVATHNKVNRKNANGENSMNNSELITDINKVKVTSINVDVSYYHIIAYLIQKYHLHLFTISMSVRFDKN